MNFLKNRMIIGCFCIIIAIFIGFVAVPKLSYYLATDVTDVVLIDEDIIKGTQIDNSMIKVESLKTDTLPNKYIPANEKDSLIGKYANVDMFKDDVITEVKITDEALSNHDTSSFEALTLGRVALTVKIDGNQESVGSKIESGDVVTIFGQDGLIDPDIVYVKVLSVQDSDTNDIDKENTSPISLVTFDLNIAQAQKVAKLSESSNVYLGLSAKSGTDLADKLLKKQESNFSVETMGILENWYAK